MLHKLLALFEEIATPVGGLDTIRDRVRKRHFDDVIGIAGCSAAQSRNVERKPCTVKPGRSFASTSAIAS